VRVSVGVAVGVGVSTGEVSCKGNLGGRASGGTAAAVQAWHGTVHSPIKERNKPTIASKTLVCF